MSLENKRFLESVEGRSTPDAELIVKIILRISENPNGIVCVVEGKTDASFYCNANIEAFHGRLVTCANNNSTNEIDVGGKETVLKSFVKCKRHFRSFLPHCVFIVDHDIDGLEYSCNILDKGDEKYITVLPCYSFENYFLIQENIELIFNRIGLSPFEMNKFKSMVLEFMQCTYPYFALTGVMTIAQKDKRIGLQKYKKSSKEQDIFWFDFSRKVPYNLNSINYESNQMLRHIASCEKAHEIFRELHQRILNDSRFVKGKILFTYLTEYLWQMHRIDMRRSECSCYIDIVSHLSIDIQIKLIPKM